MSKRGTRERAEKEGRLSRERLQHRGEVVLFWSGKRLQCEREVYKARSSSEQESRLTGSGGRPRGTSPGAVAP